MKNRSGSLVGSVILIVVGLLFLLGNFFPELRPWRLIGRLWSNGWWLFAKFWPVLIILWGLSKLGSYFKSLRDPVVGKRSLLSGGDIVLLIFLLIFGGTATHLTRAWQGSARWSDDGFRFDVDWPLVGSRQSFEFAEEATQPVTGSQIPLEVNNQNGSVEVLAHDSQTIRVKVVKRIRADDEAGAKEIADQLKIVMDRKDSGYVLSTNRESLSADRRRGLQTNFMVWVPLATTVKVSNRFGTVSMEGVAGNHKVVNSNGPVTIKNVDGNLTVENKYGPVTVSTIAGDCRVENKYGAIDLESIGGKSEIENAYGSVDLRKAKGPVSLANRYGHVVCIDLESMLSVDARYADVKARNIGGDVQVTTSYKGIELENIQGGITVRGKHGDIGIKNDQPPVKPILVDAQYSGVVITLPKDSRFDLDVSSKYGKFVSGFDSPGLQETTEGRDLRVKGSTGQGGPKITITTSYRDIALNPS